MEELASGGVVLWFWEEAGGGEGGEGGVYVLLPVRGWLQVGILVFRKDHSACVTDCVLVRMYL